MQHIEEPCPGITAAWFFFTGHPSQDGAATGDVPARSGKHPDARPAFPKAAGKFRGTCGSIPGVRFGCPTAWICFLRLGFCFPKPREKRDGFRNIRDGPWESIPKVWDSSLNLWEWFPKVWGSLPTARECFPNPWASFPNPWASFPNPWDSFPKPWESLPKGRGWFPKTRAGRERPIRCRDHHQAGKQSPFEWQIRARLRMGNDE